MILQVSLKLGNEKKLIFLFYVYFKVHFHAIEDLNNNRVALEWAIVKFHEEKMRIINKRIKQLWREIYWGVDIDYIMIHTDEIDPTSASKCFTLLPVILQ